MRVLAILALTAGLVVSGATAATNFTGSVSTDWDVAGNWDAGVPNASIDAVIDGAFTVDVSGGTAYGVYVGGGATINVNGLTTVGSDGRFWIGASGGGTVYASLSGAIDVQGAIFNPAEGEWHGFDIGGYADVVATFEAGCVVTTPNDVGLGKDDRWEANFAADITFEQGATLDNTGAWATFGLGGNNQILTMKDGSAILGTFFQIGGTFQFDGSVWGGSSRFRNYSPDPETIIKPLSDGSVFNSDGLQMQNGGLRVDVTALTPAAYAGGWVTIMDAGVGWWGATDVALRAGTDAAWDLQIINDGANPRVVQLSYSGAIIPGDANGDGYVDDDDLSLLLSSWGQVADWANGEFSGSDPVNDDDLSILLTNWHVGVPAAAGELVPEPATMILLGLGGIALIRKRK